MSNTWALPSWFVHLPTGLHLQPTRSVSYRPPNSGSYTKETDLAVVSRIQIRLLACVAAASTAASTISRLSWSSMSYYTRIFTRQYTLYNCNPEYDPLRIANVDLGGRFYRFILSFLTTPQRGPLGSGFSGATEIHYYLQSRSSSIIRGQIKPKSHLRENK